MPKLETTRKRALNARGRDGGWRNYPSCGMLLNRITSSVRRERNRNISVEDNYACAHRAPGAMKE